MNTSRRHRIDRATAEQLLTGGPGRPTTTDSGLAGLLAAAAAPPRQVELAGEGAALTAFRQAIHQPAPTIRRFHMLQLAIAKVATVKLVLATASAVGVSGVALAASTGALPEPAQNAAHSVFGAPAPDSRTEGTKKAAAAAASAEPGPSVTPSPSATSSPSATAGRGTPSPSFNGLCKAYKAHPMSERGKAMDSSAFTALAAAAGGKDRVAAYCDALLAASASDAGRRGKAKPSVSAPSSDRPGGRPGGAGRSADKTPNPNRPSHASDPGRPGHAPDKSAKPGRP